MSTRAKATKDGKIVVQSHRPDADIRVGHSREEALDLVDELLAAIEQVDGQ